MLLIVLGAIIVPPAAGAAGGGYNPPGLVHNTPLPTANGSTHELSMVGDIIWISQPNADRVLRATVAGGRVTRIQSFDMPVGSLPHGIAPISGASVWVTLEGTDKLVRLDAEGRIRRSIDLPAGSGPHGLLLATNGRLWYTGKEGSVVGQADPATRRVTRQIRLPAGSQPIYVTEGRNGAIWWTELSGSRVGRFQNGHARRMLLPNSGPGSESASPIAVDVSAEGDVWFSERDGNAAGLIPAAIAEGARAGIVPSNIRLFQMPNAASMPAGLAIAANGDVWVQTAHPYGVVRIRQGRMMQFNLPHRPINGGATAPVPHRIHAEADGSLWYSELLGDWIGRIVPRRS